MGFYGLLVVAAIIVTVLVARMGTDMYQIESGLTNEINLYKGIVGIETFWSVGNGTPNSALSVNITRMAYIDGMDITESHGIITVSESFYPKVYKSYG